MSNYYKYKDLKFTPINALPIRELVEMKDEDVGLSMLYTYDFRRDWDSGEFTITGIKSEPQGYRLRLGSNHKFYTDNQDIYYFGGFSII